MGAARIGSTVNAPSNEPKAIPTFQKDVRVFETVEKLREALRYMEAHEFTQVVVRRRGKIELLSTEGVVKWLTTALPAGRGRISSPSIAEVMPFEKRGTFAVMKPSDPVSAVHAALRGDAGRPKVSVVIITDDGTSRGRPIGFVTPWDMLLTYSDDFRDIKWQGQSFGLTPRQAEVVRLLYRAYENGTPQLSDKFICAALHTSESRLRDTFRKSKVWGTLIIPGNRPGTRRLNF
jgi:hypothetical protein